MDVHNLTSIYTIYFSFYIFNIFPITICILLVVIGFIQRLTPIRFSTISKMCVVSVFMTLFISIIASNVYPAYPSLTLFSVILLIGAVVSCLISGAVWWAWRQHKEITTAVSLLCVFIYVMVYPKPYNYFTYSAISTPVLLQEIFPGTNVASDFPGAIRMEDRISCDCVGSALGKQYGEYPFYYELCVGIPINCRETIVDLCPQERSGAACTIIQTEDL